MQFFILFHAHASPHPNLYIVSRAIPARNKTIDVPSTNFVFLDTPENSPYAIPQKIVHRFDDFPSRKEIVALIAGIE